MKAQFSRGRVSEHAHGLGTVTQEMVEERAREIAITNGRPAGQYNEADLIQAREELLGSKAHAITTEDAGEDLVERTGLPGETGRRAPTREASDEQTFAEQLAGEGVEEANHEQMVQGNQYRKERDR
jgi:hypothetical protein